MSYLFKLTNVILLTVIAYFGVQLMYAQLEQAFDLPAYQIQPSEERAPRTRARPLPQKPRSHYQTITQRNLFNASVRQAETPAQTKDVSVDDLDKLERTDLEVKLWGTVTGSGRNLAYAVIEDRKTRKQALYKEGDTILEASIKKILREKVILNLNSKDQVLEMAEDEQRSPVSRSPLRPAVSPAGNTNSLVLDRSMIDEQTRDINTLMRQVRVRPHFSKGKPDGLLLYGIKNDSLFQKMGLRNGDIIMGVDGRDIKSVDDALSLYNNLTSATNVTMQIKRRGKIEEIDYHVQ